MKNFRKFFTYDYYLRKEILILKYIHSRQLVFAETKRRYYWTVFKKLHYRRPKDINEKIMWLTRYYQDPLKTYCADKYLVRNYVESKGLRNLLIPIIGIWDNANDIDFSLLPERFVLKCNHGSGWNIICKDKKCFDEKLAVKELNDWMNQKYGAMLQEIHYDGIEPKIICEPFMEALNGDIIDYKFHCSRGKVHSCLVCYNRNEMKGVLDLDHYDIEWNRTDAIKDEFHLNRRRIDKPTQYSQMLEIASVLSRDFDYVRVDLYEIEGNVLFGELTFTPYANIMTYYKQYMLDELGDFVKLPPKKSFKKMN